MAHVKYNGEFPADRDSITQHGYVFEKGKSVEVTDADMLAKLTANRFFEVTDDDEPKRGPGRPRKEAD